MKFSPTTALISVLLILSCVEAAAFRAAVTRAPRPHQLGPRDQSFHLAHRDQKAIGPWRDRSEYPWNTHSPKTAGSGLPVGNIEYFGYRAYIGVGSNPAQLMRALIDINWADMIIPSVNCTNCDHRLKYNSSRSSTYEANGTELLLDWNYTFGKGFVSVDTITVGDGVRIPHHPFLEASQSSVGPFGEEDTILGLAIDKPLYEFPDRPSQHKLPSPFATMAEKGNLDRNVVALLLPKGDRDLGDIMFGDLDSDLYEGELSTHPLYPEGTTNWQIEANSAQVVDQDGTIIFEEHFPGFIAQLHTSFPYTVLPPAIGFAILDATGADGSNDCHGFEVPCNKLSELPHVRFNLGGHNITLTGEDYAVETDVTWPFCAHSVYCTMLIAPGHPDIYEEKRIELGSSFLKGVYSAYDLDSKSVYLAKAKHQLS